MLYREIMDLNLVCLVILFASGCNSGVVRQRFAFDHSDPVDVEIEKVLNNNKKNESDSTLENSNIPSVETPIATVEDDHNSSTSAIVDFHHVSQDLNATKDQVSDESQHFVNIHSKDFNHSKQGVSKGSGRSKKRHLKGSSRFKNSSPKETRHVEKDHFDEDTFNGSHHSQDLTRELSHDEVSKISDHNENLGNHLNVTGNRSDHAEGIGKESNQFVNHVSRMTNHSENNRNVHEDRNDINRPHVGDTVKDFNHFSEHSLDKSNHDDSSSDINESNKFDHLGFVNESFHQVEHNVSERIENALETGKEILGSSDIMAVETVNLSDVTLNNKDETTESPFKIANPKPFNEFNHTTGVSKEFNNIGHNFSDLADYHEDVINNTDWENITHSESPVSEADLSNQTESFHSSEIEPKEEESSFIVDIHIDSTNDNASDFLISQALLDQQLQMNNQIDSHATLVNSHLNETISEDAYVMFTVTSLEDETNSSTDLSTEIQDLVENKSVSINEISNPNIKSVDENNTTGGLFSGIGLDFLMNSELAKNAASAMEVFNFTDSALTDHIIDDNNDMHDFLDLMHSPADDSKSNLSPNQSFTPFSNATELNTITDGMSKINRDSMNGSDKVGNSTDEALNVLSSKNDGNEDTSIISKPLLNSTVVFEEIAVFSQPIQSSTVELEETTTMASHSALNSTPEFIVDAVCPPPGICIFWFLAQDTCAVNSHCLGSRICCRIGCAKTCIEVNV